MGNEPRDDPEDPRGHAEVAVRLDAMLVDPVTLEQYVDDDEESVSLYRWRRQMFKELGFNRRQAAQLAEDGADWHVAKPLLADGCPVDIAFDLLSR